MTTILSAIRSDWWEFTVSPMSSVFPYFYETTNEKKVTRSFSPHLIWKVLVRYFSARLLFMTGADTCSIRLICHTKRNSSVLPNHRWADLALFRSETSAFCFLASRGLGLPQLAQQPKELETPFSRRYDSVMLEACWPWFKPKISRRAVICTWNWTVVYGRFGGPRASWLLLYRHTILFLPNPG